jgi:hypothetical protein
MLSVLRWYYEDALTVRLIRTITKMPTMPKMAGMDQIQNYHYDKKFKLTPNAQFSHKDA